MRKDVKLGLAIGAILLAVVIVWAATPRHRKNTGVVLNKTQPTLSSANSPQSPAHPDDAGQQTPATPQPQSEQPAPTPPGTPGSEASAGGAAAPGGNASDNKTSANWGALLHADDDHLPALLSQSRTNTADTVEHPTGTAPVDTRADPQPIPASHENHGGMIFDPVPPGPQTRPSEGLTAGERTHTVAAGETLTSIAKSVYGKSSMYLAIEKANPNVNPNRLRPGTVIKLPAATAASADSATSNTAAAVFGSSHSRADAAIDPTKEYRVQPGDNLQRIATKLYGEAARADELYTTNKDTIGADPAKLKVGEVLKLPEPPSAAH